MPAGPWKYRNYLPSVRPTRGWLPGPMGPHPPEPGLDLLDWSGRRSRGDTREHLRHRLCPHTAQRLPASGKRTWISRGPRPEGHGESGAGRLPPAEGPRPAFHVPKLQSALRGTRVPWRSRSPGNGWEPSGRSGRVPGHRVPWAREFPAEGRLGQPRARGRCKVSGGLEQEGCWRSRPWPREGKPTSS